MGLSLLKSNLNFLKKCLDKWVHFRPYIAFLGVLVYVLGIVTILNPDGVHFFLSRWKYNNPELSEPGRLLEQIGGGFIVVIGIGIMTGALLLLV